MEIYTKVRIDLELREDSYEAKQLLEYMIYNDFDYGDFPSDKLLDYIKGNDAELFSTKTFLTNEWTEVFCLIIFAMGKDVVDSTLIGNNLRLDFTMKNYEKFVQKLFKWLFPYVVTKGFVGTYTYQGDMVDRPIYFHKNGWEIRRNEDCVQELFWGK